MAKKKKSKSRQARKEVQAKKANLSAEQLMKMAEDAMKAGKYRDAVSHLKLALKNGGRAESVHPQLFEAYLFRSQELVAGGMATEAQGMVKSALHYLEDVTSLSEEALGLSIRTLPLRVALPLIKRLCIGDVPSELASIVAMQLFVSGGWEALSCIGADEPLIRDSKAVQEALTHMDGGRWAMAREVLLCVGKESPYSAIRLFTNAMVSFERGDDRGLKRALSALPDGFPLKKSVSTLKRAAEESHNVPDSVDPDQLSLFWGDGVEIHQLIGDVGSHVDGRDLKAAGRSISRLAEICAPECKEGFLQAAVEMIWNQTVNDMRSTTPAQQLSRSLLSKGSDAWVRARSTFFSLKDPFTDTEAYLAIVMKQEKDDSLRKVLVSLILAKLVEEIEGAHGLPYHDERGLRTIGKSLGERLLVDVPSSEWGLSLLERAIEADPLNYEAYGIVPAHILNTRDRENRKRVQSLYQVMADHFPEDPAPCLTLATLYYKSNAFRKAEKILKEAHKRAPHNLEVREKSVLACLISADKNIRKGKGELARIDLDKADEMAVPSVAMYVALKRAYYAIAIEKEDVHDVARGFISFPAVEKLRGLALLSYDVHWSTLHNAKSLGARLNSFLKQVNTQVDEFSSDEARQLLQPNAQVNFLYGGVLTIGFQVSNAPEALKRLTHRDFIYLTGTMVSPQTFVCLKMEALQRARCAAEHEVATLDFLVSVFSALHDPYRHDVSSFRAQLEAVASTDKELLRVTCRKLAPFAASMTLSRCLESFDFDMRGMPSFPFDDENDWDGWDDDEDDDPFGGSFEDVGDFRYISAVITGIADEEDIQDFLQAIERMVTDLGLSHMPDFLMDNARQMIGVEALFERLKAEGLQPCAKVKARLSKKAQRFFYGKKSSKAQAKKR